MGVVASLWSDDAGDGGREGHCRQTHWEWCGGDGACCYRWMMVEIVRTGMVIIIIVR